MSPAGNSGRNHPCPCGSGKKYEKCCLKKAPRSAAPAAPAPPSEDSLLRDALQRQRAGCLMSAADLYRRILQQQPRSVAARKLGALEPFVPVSY